MAKGKLFVDNDSLIHLADYCPLLEVLNFNSASVRNIIK